MDGCVNGLMVGEKIWLTVEISNKYVLYEKK